MATNNSYPKKSTKEMVRGWSNWELFIQFSNFGSITPGQSSAGQQHSCKLWKDTKEKV